MSPKYPMEKERGKLINVIQQPLQRKPRRMQLVRGRSVMMKQIKVTLGE